MTGIASDIDEIILYQLKLHQTTTEDLLCHVADKLTPLYPDADFNSNGIRCRLDALKLEGKVKAELVEKQKLFEARVVWSLCQPDTVPNKVWHILTQLASLECHHQNIAFTLAKQDPSVSHEQIKLAIAKLEAYGIAHTEKDILKVSPSERQFIVRETVQ